LFVGVLLLALASVWGAHVFGGAELTIQDMAGIGSGFFRAIVSTQISLVLLAAPAATAGAICQDKARGNLMQLLMTDLSNTEIVLGKLAGRILPVLAMVGCTLPVLTLCTLLGGIDPLTLAGAFVMSLSLAVFVCAIAFAFSIWGTKSHEVLLATYAVLAIWMLAFPVWMFFTSWRGFPPLPHWAIVAHPYLLAFAPYDRPGEVGIIDFLGFTAVALFLSAVLLTLSITKMRAVVVGQADHPVARRSVRGWSPFGLGQGPALDASPVLWYEWHRKRPSPWIRGVIRLYFGLALGFSLIAIDDSLRPSTRLLGWFPAFVNAFQVAMGLPLLLIAATTALAEERTRGSLDVLLTTPLSSRSIVLAKWWSVFREVPRLLWLPSLVALILACISDQWTCYAQLVLYIVVVTAAWTSIGLALSTWISRLGRAVSTAVTLYALASLGWPLLVLTLLRNDQDLSTALAEMSPFHGLFDLTITLSGSWWFRIVSFSIWLWIILYALVAAALLVATLATFNRALGRIPDKARRPRTPVPSTFEPVPALSFGKVEAPRQSVQNIDQTIP